MGAVNDAANELLPEDLEGLQNRLAELNEEQKQCKQRIRNLSESEDPAAGIFFAQEIHAERQLNMVLEFKKDFCKARLNRLNLPD